MSKTIADLDEPFQSKVKSFLAELDRLGIRYAVTETRRSYLAQAEAFRAGNSRCDGCNKISMHQAGLAIDIVPVDKTGKPTWDYLKYKDIFSKIGGIAESMGMEWGGNKTWAPVDERTGFGFDPPHIQFKA